MTGPSTYHVEISRALMPYVRASAARNAVSVTQLMNHMVTNFLEDDIPEAVLAELIKHDQLIPEPVSSY